MRTFHSRNSHSSEGVAGGTGRTAGIAQEQIHLYYSRSGGEVKESIESLGTPAVAKNYASTAEQAEPRPAGENGTASMTDSLIQDPDSDEDHKMDAGLGVQCRRLQSLCRCWITLCDLLRPVAAVALTGRNEIWKSF